MSDFIRVGGVQKLQDGEFIFQVYLSFSLHSSLLFSQNVNFVNKIHDYFGNYNRCSKLSPPFVLLCCNTTCNGQQFTNVFSGYKGLCDQNIEKIRGEDSCTSEYCHAYY